MGNFIFFAHSFTFQVFYMCTQAPTSFVNRKNILKRNHESWLLGKLGGILPECSCLFHVLHVPRSLCLDLSW